MGNGMKSPTGSGISRRHFVQRVGAVAGAAAASRISLNAQTAERKPPETVAILATKVSKYSHVQHFVDRFLEGYGWKGHHYRPRLRLASLYVDQFPENDLARERSERHGVPIYPTIQEALTLGGSELAVDGVLIIAEHGDYPSNDKGQKLYPRYEFFKQTVKVFEQSGRSVPVFNDKHLSTDWGECLEMVEDSRRLKFPFLAGSSLPVTWRIPSLEFLPGSDLKQSVCVCYGGIDSYDIHGLETAQCMSERRRGGESGIRSVEALRGDAMWHRVTHDKDTERLLFAALARSLSLTPPAGLSTFVPTLDYLRQNSPSAVAYFVEHLDGFRTVMFLLNGLVRDFTYAGLRGNGQIDSCLMHLPMPPWLTTLADFFNPLVNNIEQMIIAGKAPYPIERTLLTSGMTIAGVESLHQGQVYRNPTMDIAYQPPHSSAYWRS